MSAAALPAMNAETVLQALSVLHGQNSTNQQRQQAQQYCEQVKSNPQQCLQISLQLLQTPANAITIDVSTARHFALHSLEHFIGANWSTLGEQEKLYIKQQAISLAENCASLSGGVRFLKQTMAQILTNLALREWPQRWPDLFEKLFRIASASTDGTELLSFVLRNLAEEMTTFDSSVLPDARRKEVQASLMISLDQIIPFLTRTLRDGVGAIKTNAASVNTCRAIIEAIHALLDWIPAKYVFESGMVADLCADLVHKELFEQACDCLSSITMRKSSTIDAAYSQQLLGIWDATLNWTGSIQSSATFPRQQEFMTKIVNVVNNLTKNHIEILVSATIAPASNTVAPQQVIEQIKSRLISTLGALFNHPLQKLSLIALDLWVHLFRHHLALFNNTSNPAFRSGLITELLKLSCLKMSKMDVELYEEQDFESIEEYNHFFSNFRGSILHLLQQLAELDPTLCFQVTRMRYEQLLSQPQPTDHLNADGFVSTRTSRFVELEAAGSLLEGLFRAVPQAKFAQGTELFTTTEGLLRFILSWQTSDPLLQTRRAHVLSMFTPILIHSGTLFQSTIEALMNGVSFRPKKYESVAFISLPEDLKACRRRSIVSLVQLARKKELVQQFFLPIFNQLVQAVLSLLQQERIAQVEKIALFEFLVSISQSLASIQEQQAFLKNILEQPLTSWTDATMNQVLADDGAGFKQLIGLNAEDQQTLQNPTSIPATHRTASRGLRSTIRFTLHTFMSVFKPMFTASNSGTAIAVAPKQNEATQMAATQLLPMILPNVIRLLGHIYSIRSDAFRAQLPPAMLSILSPTADLLLNPDATSMSTQSVPPPKHYYLQWDIRRWMDRILDSGMTILMLASKSGQGYYESISQPQTHSFYLTHLYSHLQYMNLREIRLFFDRYLESTLNLCPPQLYISALIGTNEQNQPTNTLPTILTCIHQRVQQAWERMIASKQPGAPKNNSTSDSLSNEIHEENELRELSRCISENIARTIELQYVTLHTAHVVASNPSTPTSREAERLREAKDKESRAQEAKLLMQVPFCQFIFTQTNLLNSLMSLLIYLLGTPDSTSSVRAVRLLHRILPVAIGSQNPLAIDAFNRVFQCGVNVLSTGKQQLLDTVEAELAALLKDIYQLFVIPNLSIQPRQTLFTMIPNLDPASVTALETTLSTLCSEKKYRSAMRQFFDRNVKAKRLEAQKSVLNSANGVQAAALTNPLDLIQANGSTSNSSVGRQHQVANIETPLVLPQRARNTAPIDIPDIGQLFG